MLSSHCVCSLSQIDPSTSETEVVFKSNFMGSMASGLFIPPNTIDFDTVFDDIGAKTRENPYVLIVCCILIGSYLLLLIPVRRMDVRDLKKVCSLDLFSSVCAGCRQFAL